MDGTTLRPKRFLLGVGCQKGGTTWLHQYLESLPEVDLGFTKEYHVLDALHLPRCRQFIDKRIQTLKQLLDEGSLFKPGHPHLLQRIDFCRDIRHYYHYFDSLWNASDRVRVVGDITPSYAALPADIFREVRSALLKRRFEPRVIFLMRDPLERIRSGVRMGVRNENRDPRCPKDARSEQQRVLDLFQTPDVESRTRYEKTLVNLEAVFPAGELHLEFSETLFTEFAVRRLVDFLGVGYRDPDFDQRVNATEKTEEIGEAAAAAVVRHYSETYRELADRFGEAFMRGIWSSYRYLD